ncbi:MULTISPECIES: alpha/beta family hydrolase [unclassified Arthrobacter]|uniref:alpha/beta hydrolase family protein n=1 Tax=unclassified Arthrobacter TaxID=235627 RepID=UPI001D14B814|nr:MULTISPECIES: alpha/beta family hydrolase [unclassified Arthrobacter]MCC3290741.1 dienelactone hydrolase [Arthrobacter sp. zg-Y1110]MCC3301871.1 dienelactone hydrolase [Arthrobacter sp. zg-Y895]UWX86156.1 dienelactone hydrolase [Arthrobacter sp. zg-Y1110]
MQVDHLDLTIPVGEANVSAVLSRPEGSAVTVVVAHGAGTGMEHPFLTGFTGALNDGGAATLRFNFPYREAGKKFPDRAPVAVETWKAVMDTAAEHDGGGPVWACGKSFGGRMASMAVAEGMPAAGLVYLGYPLHPPGKPEKLRDEHLYGLTLPMLFLQGTRDTFALPGELEPVAERIGPNAHVQRVEGGNHSFEVRGQKRTPEAIGASLAAPVLDFIRDGAKP